ncbi:MAG: hypothetical protein LUC90_02400 [Lachnospiraceae bacterium]|nr:hypothetical protein [Lachnospiraceae bacterium]
MEYRDYRYVMQDAGKLYVGGKFSLGDLATEKDVPFKFQAILNVYVMKEVDPETTIESLFYYMEGTGMVYQTFQVLHTKIKVSEKREIRKFRGGTKTEYREQIYSLDDFIAIPVAEKTRKGMLIQEIQCSKLAIMAFSL